jgi:hypothetical protein
MLLFLLCSGRSRGTRCHSRFLRAWGVALYPDQGQPLELPPVSPSEKNSCSVSPLMLINGRTAIDGTRALASGAAPSMETVLLAPDGWPVSTTLKTRMTGYILDVLVAEVLVSYSQPIPDLITHRRRDADSAWMRYGLKPGRHIDAVTQDIVSFHITSPRLMPIR